MGLINYINLTDGMSAAASIWNTRFAAIVNEINGNLDADNIKPGSLDSTTLEDGAVTAQKLAINAATGNDGWISTTDTLVYVSASQFKIVGSDKTTTYTKGTRLKWTQTTVKYGVVISSSLSGSDTLINIAVNTDYTIANAPVSANYYSYAANPQGYPDRFRFTGVVTAPGGTAPTYTSNECYFSYTGGTINVSYLLSNSSGGTAGSGAVTLLVSSPTVAPATRCGFGAIYNGGTTIDSKIIMNFLAVGDGVSSTLYLAGDGAYNALASNQSNANRYIHLTLTYQF